MGEKGDKPGDAVVNVEKGMKKKIYLFIPFFCMHYAKGEIIAHRSYVSFFLVVNLNN